jgi:SagB-type dehydrogenase family enzyme
MMALSNPKKGEAEVVRLPRPRFEGGPPLERVLRERRSVRDFGGAPLTPAEISQVLWAAQGITSRDGGRTAPSAGALYPLEIYLVAGNVTSLPPGVYKYRPDAHDLVKRREGDMRKALASAALDQSCVESGAVVLVFTAVYERVTGTYGRRGVRYTEMEAGHAAQNVHLQAVALGLGTVAVGAFDENAVTSILLAEKNERALYIIPVGRTG